MLLVSAQPITGSNALSCSCPDSDAMVIIRSLPITSYATWFTTSGMTGLTLPGMIEEPAWRAGRKISPNPAWGPEDSSRRSLAILDSLHAMRFSTPESWTNAPVSCVASTRLGDATTGTPLYWASRSTTFLA